MAISSSPERSKLQSLLAATNSIMSTGFDWRSSSSSIRLMHHPKSPGADMRRRAHTRRLQTQTPETNTYDCRKHDYPGLCTLPGACVIRFESSFKISV